jgi:hypothetical protein
MQLQFDVLLGSKRDHPKKGYQYSDISRFGFKFTGNQQK